MPLHRRWLPTFPDSEIKRLLDCFKFSDVCGCSRITRCFPRMGMHRAAENRDESRYTLPVFDVIVDQRLIGGLEELFACGALKVAVNFHGDRRKLGTECIMGINFRYPGSLSRLRSGSGWDGCCARRQKRPRHYCRHSGIVVSSEAAFKCIEREPGVTVRLEQVVSYAKPK